MRRPRLGLALLVVAVGFASCTVQDQIDDRIWSCTTSEDCGTSNGEPMACWRGYCMPGCDLSSPAAEGTECVRPGALLQTCALEPNAEPCPDGLNCYRTDLLLDVGVCVPTPTCATDADCAPGDMQRSTCASALLEDFLGNYALLLGGFGQLECIQYPCEEDSDCAPGEACLNEHYSLPREFPRVCVPKCDGQIVCPINYACAQLNGATGASRVCLPGLPGVRCSRSEDCLVGDCLETTAGFSVCSQSCESDAGCSIFNSTAVHFWCVEGAREKLCVTTGPFQGAYCDVAQAGADCPPETPVCFEGSPYGFQIRGECRLPCDEDGRCPARGGLPHVCLSRIDAGCYPGKFGMPCNETAECLSPLECLEVPLDGFENYPDMEPRRCTVRCGNDDGVEDELDDSDCDAVLVTGQSGYCGGGFCRLEGPAGRACERNAQCASGQCVDGSCAE